MKTVRNTWHEIQGVLQANIRDRGIEHAFVEELEEEVQQVTTFCHAPP